MSGMHPWIALVVPSEYTCLRLGKSLRLSLDMIRFLNKVGEGYKIREESER